MYNLLDLSKNKQLFSCIRVYNSLFLFKMVTEVMKMREEEKNQSSQWKNFFKKRWVFPAIYLACAALLISGIVWYQSSVGDNLADQTKDQNKTNEEATGKDEQPVIEVNTNFENVAMPVLNEDEVKYVTEFFDPNASREAQEAALIVDGDTYRPNLGVDIAMNDGSAFEVLAALSGDVTAVRQDALLGNVIEIDHGEGVKTVYQSIRDIEVSVGDKVKQGDTLAISSTSQLNKEAKNHVHFEIRKNNIALNPISFFGQPLTAIQDYDSEAQAEGNEEAADQEDATNEETNQQEDESSEETTDQDDKYNETSGTNTDEDSSETNTDADNNLEQ